MAKRELVAVERTSAKAAAQVEGKARTYGAPQLFVIGSAVELVQGMISGRYLEPFQSGRSNFPRRNG